MNILLAGASGFVGRELIRALLPNHHITAVGRKRGRFSQQVTCCTWDELSTLNANDYDAVINLCGYNIGASLWTKQVKKQLISSRVKTSEALIEWIISHKAKPHLLCANAVGIYGLQENGSTRSFDEDSPIDFKHPHDFLSEIGIRWQEALNTAVDYGMPVTTMRFGVILKKNGGMLKKLVPSFYFGMGSILGDGKQAISWVHMEDLVAAVIFLLNKPEITGAVNITSPNPCSQAEFAQVMARCMHRPLLLTLPKWLIRMLLGEMGDSLLLKGQRVLPKRLMESGFKFQHPQLAEALQCEFN